MTQLGRALGPSLTMMLCYASSEDDIGPATALRKVTRNSRGWQSAKRCDYPAELGFRFEGLVQLDMIRLLAHECKIPSSIVVSVATPTAEEQRQGVCSTYETAQFRPLGHVRFHTNEQKEFCSRELKSVGVGQQCAYLRLRFNRPHRDAANPFGQVSLVAITAHGALVRAMRYPSRSHDRTVIVGETIETRLEEMAPLTREESEVASNDAVQVAANKIEVLRREKTRAVAEEDYDRAGRLKAQIEALEKAQGTVAKLEAEKRAAVEAEDYARAKQLRLQIDALLNVDSPHELSPRAPSSPAKEPRPQTQRPQHEASSSAEPRQQVPLQDPPQQERGVALRSPHNNGAAPNGYHEEAVVGGRGFYDIDSGANPFGPSGSAAQPVSSQGDRTVSLNGNGEGWEQPLNKAIAGFIPDSSAPTALAGETDQEAKAFEKDLGVYCTACLLSKRRQLREAAVRGFFPGFEHEVVASHSPNAAEVFLTYLSTKGRGVGDPVTGVVIASCEALAKLVSGQLPGTLAISASHLAAQVAKLSPELVNRIGDANARVRQGVASVITATAHSPVGPDRLLALLMADPDKEAKRGVNYRTHLARVMLLSDFVDEYGLRRTSNSAHAFDTRQLLDQVVLPSMQNANSEVREAAAGLFAKLVVRDGAVAEPALAKLKPAQQAVVEEQLQRVPVSAPPSPSSPSPSKERRSPRHSSSEQQRQQQQQPTPTPPPSPSRQRPASVQKDGASKRHSANPYAESDVNDRPSKTLPPLESMATGAKDPEYRTSHTCQFCGEFNKNFTGTTLDIHYVRACPMLCPCPLCDQITEICSLQRHLVTECEGSRLVKECPRCREAIRAADFKRHCAMQNCIEAVAAFSVCPLCHSRFPAGMEGWRQHLAVFPGCPNNPRKFDGSGPVMQ